MWYCFNLIKAKGKGLKAKIVGWVERERNPSSRTLHFTLVPKLLLGNPDSEAPASRDMKSEPSAPGVRELDSVEAIGSWSAGKACKRKQSLHSCCNELSSILNDDVALTFCLLPFA
jgi:hypothetical protein